MMSQVEQVMARARQIRALIRTEITNATPAELMQRPGERWSARDVLVHLGNWEAQAVIWFRHLLQNEPIPPLTQEIDAWNAEQLALYAELDGAGALAYLESTRAALEQVAAEITPEHLASNPSYLALLLMTPDHEIGHLHQIREALALARGAHQAAARHYLAYARQRVLARLNLEFRSPAALDWRPDPTAWSIKELLFQLAESDRQAAGQLAEEKELLPPAPITQALPEAAAYTLADLLAELGAARSALEGEIDRLTADRISNPAVQAWLTTLRKHDDAQMHQILSRLAEWRKTQ